MSTGRSLLALAASLAVLTAVLIVVVWSVGVGINETLPRVRDFFQCDFLVPFANC